MFTGIIQTVGRIVACEKRDFGTRLKVEPQTPAALGQVKAGESIAIDGVCLTVASGDEKQLVFDVVGQTLSVTTLGDKKPGDRVNLEPALVLGDRLGGHMVQGHVDGVAEVIEIEREGDNHRVTCQPPGALMRYIVPRGSVTLEGVSLTLAQVSKQTFTVALIPTTLKQTTLEGLAVGGRVNLETDMLARTIVHRLEQQAEPAVKVDLELLRAAGFVE